MESWFWGPGLGVLDLDSCPEAVAKSYYTHDLKPRFAYHEWVLRLEFELPEKSLPETHFDSEALHDPGTRPQVERLSKKRSGVIERPAGVSGECGLQKALGGNSYEFIRAFAQ